MLSGGHPGGFGLEKAPFLIYKLSTHEGMATMTSMSSVEFSQDTGRARQLAKKAPVFIIDHGETSHVLLSIEECQKLARQGKSISDLLAMDDHVIKPPPRIDDSEFRPVEFD
jgi:hypothetical protein